jgi:hypothetical protein
MQGKKEQVYWEKVPEKIRYGIVRKAVSSGNSAIPSLISVPSKSTVCVNAWSSAPSAPPTTPLSHSASAPYPLNCLLFARNVHPGTNKTTLRALFTNVFSHSRNSRNEKHSAGTAKNHDRGHNGTSGIGSIDYVGCAKGTTTCHLRLLSSYASFPVQCFRENVVVQAGPLDGGTSSSTTPNVSMDTSDTAPAHTRTLVDLVQGTREKLYWEIVLLKIRQESVRRATKVGLHVTSGSVSAVPFVPSSQPPLSPSTPLLSSAMWQIPSQRDFEQSAQWDTR